MTDDQETAERPEPQQGAQAAGQPQQNLSGESERPQEQQQSEAGGGDSPQGKAEQQEERDTGGTAGGGAEGHEDDEAAKAKQAEQDREKAAEKMRELEKDPPEKLEDWPDDMTKYETFGGPEGEHSYAEGPEEEALGPSSLRHHEDGKVSIAGDEVDNPDEFKGDPIPGGPTDPNAPQDTVAAKTKKKMEEKGLDFGEASSEGEGEDGGSSDEEGGSADDRGDDSQ